MSKSFPESSRRRPAIFQARVRLQLRMEEYYLQQHIYWQYYAEADHCYWAVIFRPRGGLSVNEMEEEDVSNDND